MTILITGASKGIGRAIALALLEENYKVIGVSRNSTIDHPNFFPFPCDLNDLDKLPEQLKKLSEKHPQIDHLICNAGRGQFGSLEEFSFSQIRSLLDLNFLSHTFVVKAFLPQMKKRQKGNIVFIGSEAALQGKRKGSIYCAAKFALRGFAKALRDECMTSHIGVTLINPGMVKSDFFNELSFEPGHDPSEHILPEDIAHAVSLVLKSRAGTVFDEINLSPQRNQILKKETLKNR